MYAGTFRREEPFSALAESPLLWILCFKNPIRGPFNSNQDSIVDKISSVPLIFDPFDLIASLGLGSRIEARIRRKAVREESGSKRVYKGSLNGKQEIRRRRLSCFCFFEGEICGARSLIL